MDEFDLDPERPEGLYKIFADLRKAIPKRIGPIRIECNLWSDTSLHHYADRIENVFRGIARQIVADAMDALEREVTKR